MNDGSEDMKITLERKGLSTDKKMIFICWLAYASAYVGRLNFSAVLVALVEDMNTTKEAAGLVGSCFFFAYGIGQLVNGLLSKYYNTKVAVFAALTASSVLNILMPLSGSIAVMKYLWLLNGAAQSVLWCTVIKTISDTVSGKMFSKAVLVMSTPNVAGTILAYGVSAVFVGIGQWKYTFVFAAVVMFASAVIWFVLFDKDTVKKIAPGKKTKFHRQLPKISKILLPTFTVAALSGIADGFLKDGISTWTSTVLYEEFGLSQSFSIVLTLSLPVVAAFGAFIMDAMHKRIPSYTTLNLILFAGSIILCSVLIVSLQFRSLIPVMLCFIGISCLMSMVTNVVTSIFPLEAGNYADSGLLAGVLNAFCYIGSTTASYGLGKISVNSGWNTVFYIMLAVSAAALLVCALGGGYESVFIKKQKYKKEEKKL